MLTAYDDYGPPTKPGEDDNGLRVCDLCGSLDTGHLQACPRHDPAACEGCRIEAASAGSVRADLLAALATGAVVAVLYALGGMSVAW